MSAKLLFRRRMESYKPDTFVIRLQERAHVLTRRSPFGSLRHRSNVGWSDQCPLLQKRSSDHMSIVVQVCCNEKDGEDNQQDKLNERINWNIFGRNWSVVYFPCWWWRKHKKQSQRTRKVPEVRFSKYADLPQEIRKSCVVISTMGEPPRQLDP